MSAVDELLFCSLIDALLPRGGWVAGLSHVYIDESGTHDDSPVMTVAGYFFNADQARRFTRDWDKDLRRFGIPYAHMTDCGPGNGVYSGMEKAERLATQLALIQHIKRRTAFGFGVSLDPRRYMDLVGHDPDAPSPYSFCIHGCMSIMRRVIERKGIAGPIAYFFEAGHQHQAEANQHMAAYYSPGSKIIGAERVRYAAHSFVNKQDGLPLHAADMLAYHYQHFLARRLKGHDRPRKDFSAMLRPQDVCIDYTTASIEQFRDLFYRDKLRASEQPNAAE